MAAKKAVKKTTRKKAAKKKTTKRKPKAKAKKAKAPEEPNDSAKEKLHLALKAAHEGHYRMQWIRDMLAEVGYVRKGDKATKADLVRYGRAVGTVFEKVIELVAEQDQELAKAAHELAKAEMEKLNV